MRRPLKRTARLHQLEGGAGHRRPARRLRSLLRGLQARPDEVADEACAEVHPVHVVDELTSAVDLRNTEHESPVLQACHAVRVAHRLELRLQVLVQRALDLKALPDAADAYTAAREAQPARCG